MNPELTNANATGLLAGAPLLGRKFLKFTQVILNYLLRWLELCVAIHFFKLLRPIVLVGHPCSSPLASQRATADSAHPTRHLERIGPSIRRIG